MSEPIADADLDRMLEMGLGGLLKEPMETRLILQAKEANRLRAALAKHEGKTPTDPGIDQQQYFPGGMGR